jgi:hypothetical protein
MKSLAALSLILVLSLFGCSNDPADRVLETITPESVMSHVRVLADDSLTGRRPGTPGEEKAVAYLVDRLKSYGVEPAGENGTYLQPVTILSQRLLAGSSADVRKGSARVPLVMRDDMVMFSGAPKPNVRVQDLEIVFVGYGVEAPEQKWDDYKGYDVRG